MAEFFGLLLESGLLTAAFIIGAIAVFIAIVGSVKTIIELSPTKALLLAFFGVFLMALSIGGYFISLQTDKETNERTVQEPTEVTSLPPLEAASVTPIVTSETRTDFTPEAAATSTQSSLTQTNVTWQLNPTLPQPQGFGGWISTESPQDFGSGSWTQDVNVSINENQLLLVFGGFAKLPTVGEIGTRTSCFVIASRGPVDLSLDLMSARLEVHNVDATATALEWAAQKAIVMQEAYPSTCGQGLDVVVGK